MPNIFMASEGTMKSCYQKRVWRCPCGGTPEIGGPRFSSLVMPSLVPSPTLESGSGSLHIQSWGSITSAVPDLDRQCDWLIIVLHH